MVNLRRGLLFVSLVAVGFPSPEHLDPQHGQTLFLLAWIFVLFTWTAAYLVRTRALRRMFRSHHDFLRSARRYQWSRKILSVATSAVFFCLVLMGWPSAVRFLLGLNVVPMLDEWVILLPFVAALLGKAALFFRVDRAIENRFVDGDQWIDQNAAPQPSLVRSLVHEHGPWLLLVGLLTLVKEIIEGLGWSERASLALGVVLVLGTSIIAMPLVLRLCLPVERFPNGWIRTAFERWQRLQNIRIADIFIWHAPHDLANAAVTGGLPSTRYVLLTRSLTKSFPPDELLGVFGHEVGHVSRRHQMKILAASLLVIVGSSLLAVLVVKQIGTVRTMSDDTAHLLVMMVLTSVGIYLLVGRLSRLFEYEADLEGCRATSVGMEALLAADQATSRAPAVTSLGAETFARGLERLAFVNDIDTKRWRWRGGRLKDRIEAIRQFEMNPAAAIARDRQIRREVRGILLGLLGAVALTWLLTSFA